MELQEILEQSRKAQEILRNPRKSLKLLENIRKSKEILESLRNCCFQFGYSIDKYLTGCFVALAGLRVTFFVRNFYFLYLSHLYYNRGERLPFPGKRHYLALCKYLNLRLKRLYSGIFNRQQNYLLLCFNLKTKIYKIQRQTFSLRPRTRPKYLCADKCPFLATICSGRYHFSQIAEFQMPISLGCPRVQMAVSAHAGPRLKLGASFSSPKTALEKCRFDFAWACVATFFTIKEYIFTIKQYI